MTAVLDTIDYKAGVPMRPWYSLFAVLALVADAARSQAPRPETFGQAQKTFILGQRFGEDLERQDGSISDPAVLGYVHELENRLAVVAGTKGLDVNFVWFGQIVVRTGLHRADSQPF